jgi:hypothetical protein
MASPKPNVKDGLMFYSSLLYCISSENRSKKTKSVTKVARNIKS